MEGDNSMEVKYYVCKHCGNIIEKVKDKGASVICCGEDISDNSVSIMSSMVWVSKVE